MGLKKVIVGLALSSALLGTTPASTDANTKEIKDNKANAEQLVDGKSEIKEMRKKVGYLDEYLGAIGRGEDKEEAYRILTLKIADGNKEVAEQMEKAIRGVQISVGVGVLGLEAMLLSIIWSMSKNSTQKKIDEKLAALLKILKTKQK